MKKILFSHGNNEMKHNLVNTKQNMNVISLTALVLGRTIGQADPIGRVRHGCKFFLSGIVEDVE